MQRSRALIVHHSILVKVVTFTLAVSCPYKKQRATISSISFPFLVLNPYRGCGLSALK